MNNRKPLIYPAHIAGVVMLAAAFAMFFISPLLSAAVLIIYVVLCIAACFFPETNFLGPVISRGKTGQPLVALTFDDGPSRKLTPRILDLLDRHQVKAAFFVSGVNAAKNPDIMADIVNRGHEVGNHSLNHFPFLMLKGYSTIFSEISEARNILRGMGIESKIFRPPVGIVNPKLFSALDSLNLLCVVFSCRALDAGNRRIENLSSRILSQVKADDIILLHDVLPAGNTDEDDLLAEMEKILSGIRQKGLNIVPLGRLIGADVMSVQSGVLRGRGN